MASVQFQAEFAGWCDQALSGAIPAEVIAFNFNLYEAWQMEIIGCDSYSETDQDWACDEAFRPKLKRFNLPATEVGGTWNAVLQSAKAMVAAYLKSSHSGAGKLKAAEYVTVGFVEGDLERVWPVD